MQLSTGTGVQ